jgi:ubiquinone/menaquinone biosynthesis C-methylase UbiE
MQKTAKMENYDLSEPVESQPPGNPESIPRYLTQVYWWAYVHPLGVRFFERQWLVNAILWGNFSTLRDAALNEVGTAIDGPVLQVACVYGDFSKRLAERLTPEGRLDIVDVVPVQLENASNKIGEDGRVALHCQDSSRLQFEDGAFECVVVFFLLHEQPRAVREKTISEALRVTRPGGKVVFVDYHRPRRRNPLRYAMTPILRTLEPFAMDLWNQEIEDWVPETLRPASTRKETFFGGLYQKVVMTR